MGKIISHRPSMLPVRVKFYGVIRDLVEGPTAQLHLAPGSTARDLIRSLIDRYGPDLEDRILDRQGNLLNYVRLFINNRQIEGLDEKIEGEDVEAIVYVLSAAEGG